MWPRTVNKGMCQNGLKPANVRSSHWRADCVKNGFEIHQWRAFMDVKILPEFCAQKVVLLVDDEDAIRRLVRLILEMKGYLVLDACDGLEGLALCKAYGGHIDLLLSDVVMPKVGGRELAEGALRMRPGMKILFMSGHNEDIVVENGIRWGNGFLQKPFTSQALALKILATMDLQPV
jgi:CheY-like chemotaxis protein